MIHKKTFYQLAMLAMITIVSFISGCKNKTTDMSQTTHITIVTAKLHSEITRLYYKGTLSPIKTVSVLSPVEGSVTKLYFRYGDFVQKDQMLAVIDSTKLAEDYREAVTKYLQSKDTYVTGKQTYEGNLALYKAGVISANEYFSGKSQYETNVLNYYQAKFNLEKILTKANMDPQAIEKLSIVDTKEVNLLLQKQFTHIDVRAPSAGVALFPVSSDSSDNKTGKLTIGSSVKEGQLILSVGDLSGFSATLQVSEISINKITAGLPAIVTGDAFPGITLAGVVTAVANQANPDQSGGNGSGLSLFNIEIQIPNVTPAQQKIIHVGMTATIEIDIKNPPHLLLPIQAVFQKNGQSMVTLIDPKTKQHKDVPVITGDTTLTDVTILSGVKAGDEVVVHD